MNEKQKASAVIDYMSEWDSDAVINILQAYISDESLANLYDTLVREGVIDAEDGGEEAEALWDDGLDYSPTMRKAVAYAMEQMEPEDIAIIGAKVGKNFKQDMNPAYGIDEGKISDLLEEYGQDNDLPEGWWMEECNMDDIVLLIAHES